MVPNWKGNDMRYLQKAFAVPAAPPPGRAGEDHGVRGLRLRTWRSCDVVPGGFGSRPYLAYFSDNATSRSRARLQAAEDSYGKFDFQPVSKVELIMIAQAST
jgi:hypothetical protein